MTVAPPTPVMRHAWLWVVGGFLFQSIPAAIRDEALPIALKNTGVDDARITQVVAYLGLAVGVKVLWAPLMPFTGPTRRFILSAQAAILFALLGLAFLVASGAAAAGGILALLALVSILSAGHDFALDGYFVASLDDQGRARHSGLLSFASKTGQVLAGPGLIWWAGHRIAQTQPAGAAWQEALFLAALLGALAWSANLWAFRREPAEAAVGGSARARLAALTGAWRDLFADARFPAVLGLIFFYRASEIHMARVLPLFAIAPRDQGGLALGNETYALLRIPTAVFGLALGGVVGSLVVSRFGLGRSLVPLGFLMHLPLLGIAWLAAHPDAGLPTVGLLFFVEYFAYGAGVCALLLAMMKMATGAEAAARYAMLSTIALVAGYLPGLWAGALAHRLGYAPYFLFALALALPGLLAANAGRRAFAES